MPPSSSPILRACTLVAALAMADVAHGDPPVDDAIAKLSSPDTWCDAAAELARRGDPAALLPLVKAYQSPAETSRTCLLDAMEALGARQHAAALYAKDARVGLDLMRLFPDDAHLPALVAAVATDDARTRFVALRALTSQLQTPAWITAVLPLVAAPRTDVRKAVIDVLARRDEPEVAAALRAQAAVESDAALKAQLELVVGP